LTVKSLAPDISAFPLPIDQWTQPFWDAAARRELVMPRCTACQAWRWPPTPFCPKCRSQALEWLPAGAPRLYSFTVVRQPGPSPQDPYRVVVPGLVEFPAAGGMRLIAAIVDSEIDAIKIGAALTVGWTAKEDTYVPVFAVEEAS
jgi:uncharacterized OB-fold protein